MVRLHLALCVLPWVANLAPPTPRHLLPSVTVHSTKSTGSNSAKRRKTTSRPKTGMTWTSPPKASENMIQTGQTCLNWGCCLLPYANPLRLQLQGIHNGRRPEKHKEETPTSMTFRLEEARHSEPPPGSLPKLQTSSNSTVQLGAP